MHMDWYGWGMGFGWIFMFLFWGAVIALVVFLVRRAGDHGSRNETATDILKKRYAKGEITREEYERMVKDIGGQ